MRMRNWTFDPWPINDLLTWQHEAICVLWRLDGLLQGPRGLHRHSSSPLQQPSKLVPFSSCLPLVQALARLDVVASDIPCRLPCMALCLADRQPLWTSLLVPNKDLPFYRTRPSDPLNLVTPARGVTLAPVCPPVVEICPAYPWLRPGMPHNNQYDS